MPVHYKIDVKRRLIVTTGEGRITFGEIKSHQDLLLSDPAFDAKFDQLIDVTTATSFDLSVNEAKAIARRPIVYPTSRRAFVASQPAIYGMGRLMEVYHEQLAQVQIFEDRASALKWLGIEEDPGPRNAKAGAQI